MRAMNWNMNEPWCNAVANGRKLQHEDGGWGERCNTYDDRFQGQVRAPLANAWRHGLCASTTRKSALKRALNI